MTTEQVMQRTLWKIEQAFNPVACDRRKARLRLKQIARLRAKGETYWLQQMLDQEDERTTHLRAKGLAE